MGNGDWSSMEGGQCRVRGVRMILPCTYIIPKWCVIGGMGSG